MSAYYVVLSNGGASPVHVQDGPLALQKATTCAKTLASAHREKVVFIFRMSRAGELSAHKALAWSDARRQPELAHNTYLLQQAELERHRRLLRLAAARKRST